MSPVRAADPAGTVAEALKDLTDDQVAAVLRRYIDTRHGELVLQLAIAEMARRDQLIAERAAARSRVLAALAEAREAEERRQARACRRHAEYREYLEAAYLAAERDCRGSLLSPLGKRRGVHPRLLWSGSKRQAYAYASEELRNWWEIHGRLTPAEFRRQGRQQQPAA